MGSYDYKQHAKNHVRHSVLSHAVSALTVDRQLSCCVSRGYVRQIIDYYMQCDKDDPVFRELSKINPVYVTEWESLYDTIIGYRRPSDLCVCYLSGPQPENDFNELISLGILPHNIWAFENDKSTYLQAISTFGSSAFPQPKIVKMSIEQFFKQSPKKFDIVYIDACGTVVSAQHALRCVTTLLKYQRLNSPSVLITNFSEPSSFDIAQINEFSSLIASYFYFKEHPNIDLDFIQGNVAGVEFGTLHQDIHKKFGDYYGRFITDMLSDLASIIVPLQRFGDIAPYSNLFSQEDLALGTSFTKIGDINCVKNHSVCKWILLLDYLSRNSCLSNFNPIPIRNEIIGLDGNWDKLTYGTKLLIGLKSGQYGNLPEVSETRAFFEDKHSLYQFLDRPSSTLFFDAVINQLTYPLHSSSQKAESFQYRAKQTNMFTDLIVYDECRYLYEWLPAIHQIKNAMKNISWQYVFRFALDGLVKQRINYNNEFFFQGSVIAKDTLNFQARTRRDRVKVEV